MASLADYNREISELMSLLKKEIKLLRAGKYHNVERSSQLKAKKTNSLVAKLTKLGTAGKADLDYYQRHLAPRLAQLKSLSRENGQLLQGVLNGVQSAQDRIHAIRNHQTNVGVYGREGRSMSFEEQPASSEKTF